MINYDLKKIRTIIFDIDGVLSCETIPLGLDGVPCRIAIITGCKIEAVGLRYEGLGVEDIYLGAAVKINTYEEYKAKYGYADDEVMYMGDDIPDLEIMHHVGCPVCPKDACPEIKSASIYVSDYDGGRGCGRDVIEQTLKAQGKWLQKENAFGW